MDTIVDKILTATSYNDVFTDLSDWKKEYKRIVKQIHPDVNNDKQSADAIFKLNRFKDEIENGKKHKDDVGVITYTVDSIEIIGDKEALKTSYDNYNKLIAQKDDASDHFKKYLPSSGSLISENELTFKLPYRAIPISAVGELPQKHVNWILSRMLEFSGWINQIGYCHANINPDSIYIVPENHGIICISFYHMIRLDTQLKSISGKYLNFYPSNILSVKKGTSNIDLELSKRTAIYLLGDKSGVGNKLRRTHNIDILDFMQSQHYDPIAAYNKYREILKKHFDTKKFHILNI